VSLVRGRCPLLVEAFGLVSFPAITAVALDSPFPYAV